MHQEAHGGDPVGHGAHFGADGGVVARGGPKGPVRIYANRVSPFLGENRQTDEVYGKRGLREVGRRTLRGAKDDDTRKAARRKVRCAVVRTSERVQIDRRATTEGGAVPVVHGLETCSSVWACPVCAARIAGVRRGELLKVMSDTRKRGGSAVLLTLTVPHEARDSLQELRSLVARAWRKVQSGKAWASMCESYGVTGYVRALEVTVGKNGWHPHLHVLLLCDRSEAEMLEDLTHGELQALSPAALALYAERKNARTSKERAWRRGADEGGEAERAVINSGEVFGVRGRGHGGVVRSQEGLWLWLWRRWARAVESLGWRAPSLAHGIDVQAGNKAAEYLAKFGLAAEVSNANTTKKGRQEHLTPWQLLSRCAGDNPRPYDVARWREYVTATQGARQLTWSRGLRKAHGLDDDDGDDAALKKANDTTNSLTVEGTAWDALMRSKKEGLKIKIFGEVLEAVGAAHVWRLSELLGGAGWSWRDKEHAIGDSPGEAVPRDTQERYTPHDPVTGEVLPVDWSGAVNVMRYARDDNEWKRELRDVREQEAETYAQNQRVDTKRQHTQKELWQEGNQ